MIKAYAVLAAALFVPRTDPCAPKLEIGQTYHEIQKGPCPDIDSVAAFRADSTHVAYFCPSKSVMVVGSVVTGKMEAFFLYKPASE